MKKYEISELTTEKEWSDAWPVLNSLKPELEYDSLLTSREQLLNDGYQLFGLRVRGKIVTVAGVSITPHLTGTRNLRIIDLATLPEKRSKGYGSAMLVHLEEIARMSECTRIILHSRTERKDAHRFYESKGGFIEHASVFVKTL